MVDMLAEWVGDTGGRIWWYVFEKEWGNNYDLYVTDEDGNVLLSETYNDIWELIKGG